MSREGEAVPSLALADMAGRLDEEFAMRVSDGREGEVVNAERHGRDKEGAASGERGQSCRSRSDDGLGCQ